MATPTWGLLTKSQIDNEKIEEAVDRIVAEHNENEDSHLEAGQSLQSHKAAEIIDHLADSIVADKIRDYNVPVAKLDWDQNLITTEFESLDGIYCAFVGESFAWSQIGGAMIETGAVDEDSVLMVSPAVEGIYSYLDFSKKPFLQVRLIILDKSTAYVEVHVGYYGFQTAGKSYIGFRFDQNKIYAVCRDSAAGETAVDITGAVDSEISHDYRVVYVSSSIVEFYIDGVLKTTITTNIPVDDDEECAFFIGLKNSHDSGKQYLFIKRLIFYEQI